MRLVFWVSLPLIVVWSLSLSFVWWWSLVHHSVHHAIEIVLFIPMTCHLVKRNLKGCWYLLHFRFRNRFALMIGCNPYCVLMCIHWPSDVCMLRGLRDVTLLFHLGIFMILRYHRKGIFPFSGLMESYLSLAVCFLKHHLLKSLSPICHLLYQSTIPSLMILKLALNLCNLDTCGFSIRDCHILCILGYRE